MAAILQKDEDFADTRRRFLVQALSRGLLAGGLGWNFEAMAQLFGSVPRRLPEGQSIFELRGQVLVNGQPATRDTRIGPSDRLQTADGSYLIAVVGGTAFILREKSSLQLEGRAQLVRGMRLLTGALLSVFGKRSADEQASIRTSIATIGIRGTGVYAEADPDKTYLCTCYGSTDIAAADDPSQSEQLTTRHHDAPRYILQRPDSGRRIIPAPFINHTDLELMTLEAIVGRQVPFGLSGFEYEGPQREY